MKLLIAMLLLLAVPAVAQDQQPNHLEGEDSPYLLQHLFNPVDWYPWGPEALNKARDENKLIFLSVGYSACHWCHVMEEESFENETIAAFLNEHFVSIKVDRERRPDLDEQFMLATQALTGGGGWPNSVFLTPEGGPFFAGTYFPPDQFQSVLLQVVQLWRRDPGTIHAEGERLTEILGNYLTRKADAQELTPELVAEIARDVLPDIDFFYGGIGVTAKFPREPLFLFLLDQAIRTGDTELLGAVTSTLDGMIIGGVHDQVGGGFHRYAVDPQWHVPHFEKMLYTQALTGRLLVRAWRATGKPSYRRAAERLFTYVLRDLQHPEGGFYAAQDADSDTPEGDYVEGVYYTWKPDELLGLGADAEWLTEIFQISAEGELDGANVLNLPDFAAALAEEMGLSEPKLYARLDPLLEQMLAIREIRAAPLTDRKILMSWNGEMIATLAEAAHVFNRPDYLQAAEQAADFISNKMVVDGKYYRTYFNQSAGTAAQLPDYAALGLAYVALHDFNPDPADRAQWLTRAQTVVDIIRSEFGDAVDGYRMTATLDGISPIIAVEDGEIPSGNALTLNLFARLAKRHQSPGLELDAVRLAAALSGHAAEIPRQRSAILTASQDLQFGETGQVRHVAKGAVRVEFVPDPSADTLRVLLTISDGWHLNAHKPLEDFYIPLELMAAGQPLADSAYPAAVVKSLGFNDFPLALYEGDIVLQAPLTPGQTVLTLQACNEEICLQPETLSFRVWAG